MGVGRFSVEQANRLAATIPRMDKDNMIRNSLLTILFFSLIFNVSIASADYDKQCDVAFQSYFSPTVSGLSFSINKTGQFSFEKSGRAITKQKFLREIGNSGEEFDRSIRDLKDTKLIKLALLIKQQGDFVSGKMTLASPIDNELDDSRSIEFPKIKNDHKDTLVLDSGLSIRIKVGKSVRLTISGDFGQQNFSGPCKKYNTSSSTEMSSSNLDKLKSTCTELGFKSGTEKHGDCVLKLMDN